MTVTSFYHNLIINRVQCLKKNKNKENCNMFNSYVIILSIQV